MEVIDWIDHYGNYDEHWRSRGEIIERAMTPDVVIRTFGEVLAEDSKRVLVAGEVRVDEGLYRHYTVIYKKLIVKRDR